MIRACSIFTPLSLLFGVGAGAQEVQVSRVFDSDGVQIHYVDQGSGEPVLLIHGFTADLDVNWVEPGLFGRLREADYRVIAYDSRGHGRSDKPDDPPCTDRWRSRMPFGSWTTSVPLASMSSGIREGG